MTRFSHRVLPSALIPVLGPRLGSVRNVDYENAVGNLVSFIEKSPAQNADEALRIAQIQATLAVAFELRLANKIATGVHVLEVADIGETQ
jgi:hypothetical protein